MCPPLDNVPGNDEPHPGPPSNQVFTYVYIIIEIHYTNYIATSYDIHSQNICWPDIN